MRKPRIVIVNDGPNSGYVNMARDEYLYHLVEKGDPRIFWRFYSFDPACLSLGVFQKITDKELKRFSALPLELVRRPTGGRAVLHMFDLTYCVVFPAKGCLYSGNIRETYRKITKVFHASLTSMGVPVEMARPDVSDYHRNTDCFKSPTFWELMFFGQKVMGSAQKRGKYASLQHGSLIFRRDRKLYESIFKVCPETPELGVTPERVIEEVCTQIGENVRHVSGRDIFDESSSIYQELCEKYQKKIVTDL